MSDAAVIIHAPIVVSQTEDRIVGRREDGAWFVARVGRKDRKLVEVEASFSLHDLQRAATLALEGNPDIAKELNKQAGKALAAGILLLSLSLMELETQS